MPAVSPVKSKDLESRFQNAIDYFKQRGGVCFFSAGRFWEKHHFPHQSLGKYLAHHGVRVQWYDGQGWRPYHPVIHSPHELLRVSQLFSLPGRRVSWIKQQSLKLEVSAIKNTLNEFGGNPVMWVQEGIPEELAENLPYIDVSSPFDNPYSWPNVALKRAKLIVCQNRFARDHFGKNFPSKVRRSWPPLDLTEETFDDVPPCEVPEGFPKKIMGCVGSLMSPDFNMDLIEAFVRRLKDWGFLFMGRLNEVSVPRIKEFRKFSNFYYIPWMPRRTVAAAWKRLEVTLLLYGDYRPQDGAFPTRALESFYFGVPCVASKIPKTADLEGIVPRSSDPDELIEMALKAVSTPKEKIKRDFETLSYEMSPKLHLARVAEFLQGTDTDTW